MFKVFKIVHHFYDVLGHCTITSRDIINTDSKRIALLNRIIMSINDLSTINCVATVGPSSDLKNNQTRKKHVNAIINVINDLLQTARLDKVTSITDMDSDLGLIEVLNKILDGLRGLLPFICRSRKIVTT